MEHKYTTVIPVVLLVVATTTLGATTTFARASTTLARFPATAMQLIVALFPMIVMRSGLGWELSEIWGIIVAISWLGNHQPPTTIAKGPPLANCLAIPASSNINMNRAW